MARDVPLRTSPFEADVGNIVCLKGLDPDVQKKKVDEIHRGAAYLREMTPFPARRKCQDGIWALLFMATVVGSLALSYTYAGCEITSSCKDRSTTMRVTDGEHGEVAAAAMKNMWHLLAAGLAGMGASLVAAFAFLVLARFQTACVVWFSLIFMCVLMIAQGVVFVVLAKSTILILLGCGFILIGVIMAFSFWCCLQQRIPFTIAVVQTVADIADDHPCMVLVSLFGSFMSIVFTIAFAVAAIGTSMKYSQDASNSGTGIDSIIYVITGFVFFWSSAVVYGTCHMIYCGVFGRWYYGQEPNSLGASTSAALTKSFGSVCFGSFLLALVQTAEFVARTARRGAQKDGNIVCCLLLCVLECFLSCIGDILEYFNEWAYVQCAIRGSSYCESARITFALCTSANVQLIYSDMLIGAVVTLGAFFCMLVGSGVAAGVAYWIGVVGERALMASVGAVLGAVGGLLAGGSSMSIFSSGTKTLLSAWAEDPRPLQEMHPEIHEMFCERIVNKAYP